MSQGKINNCLCSLISFLFVVIGCDMDAFLTASQSIHANVLLVSGKVVAAARRLEE